MKLKGSKNRLKELSCKMCGKAFMGKKADMKWCSKSCSDKNYYIHNKEKVTKSNNKWRKEHYEKYRESDRKWRRNYQKSEAFKEKRRLRDFARYSLREQILARDNHKCVICGSSENLELHHKNYSRDLKDVITICKGCHNKEHSEVR